MSTSELKFKLSLAEAIDNWINENCEEDVWYDLAGWVHEDLSSDMASAAFQILKSSKKGQIAQSENGKI